MSELEKFFMLGHFKSNARRDHRNVFSGVLDLEILQSLVSSDVETFGFEVAEIDLAFSWLDYLSCMAQNTALGFIHHEDS